MKKRKGQKKGQNKRQVGNPMVWVAAVLVLLAIFCGLSQCEPKQPKPTTVRGIQVTPDVGLTSAVGEGREALTTDNASSSVMVLWDVSTPMRDYLKKQGALTALVQRLNDEILVGAGATGAQSHWLVGKGSPRQASDWERQVRNPRDGETWLLEAGYKIGEAIGKGEAGTFILVSDLCVDTSNRPKDERICTSREAQALGRANPGLPRPGKPDAGNMFGPCLEQGVLDGHGIASQSRKQPNEKAKEFGGLEHLTVDLLQHDRPGGTRYPNSTCNFGQKLFMMVLSVDGDRGQRVASRAAEKLRDVDFKQVSLIDTLPSKSIQTSCVWSPDDPHYSNASTWPVSWTGSDGTAGIDCRDVDEKRQSSFTCLIQRPSALGLLATTPVLRFEAGKSNSSASLGGVLGIDIDGQSRGKTPGDWSSSVDQFCKHSALDSAEPMCDLVAVQAGCRRKTDNAGSEGSQDNSYVVGLDYKWESSNRPIHEIKDFNNNHRNVNNLLESMVTSAPSLVTPRQVEYKLIVTPSK